jgi:hypothetical protein
MAKVKSPHREKEIKDSRVTKKLIETKAMPR